MSWDARYDTGHPEIDRQHRLLFGQIEQLGNVQDGAFSRGKDAALDLMLLILQHTAYEEDLMARYVYPAAKAHCDRHSVFTHKIIKLREDIIAGQVNDVEYQRLLVDWWHEHAGADTCVEGSDKQLAVFLAGRL